MANLTRKMEAFAQALALSSPPISQAAAYRAAYDTSGMTDKSIHECASRLSVKVAARVEALEGEALAIAQLSRGRIAHELAENRTLALADGAFAAANKATELRGDMVDAFGKREHRLRVGIDRLGAEKMAAVDVAQLADVVEAGYRELSSGDGEPAP
jgi:hypothetical protein